MNCVKCGRPITSQHTLNSPAGRMGYGPKCHRMVMRAVAVLARSDDSRAWRAAQLLTQGKISRHQHANVWRVASISNSQTYLTHPNRCTCDAGRCSGRHDDRYCYHRLAITILAA